LIDREVDLATENGGAGLDLEPRVPECGEDGVLRVVDEDVAIGEIEDLRPPVLAGAVPAAGPEALG
jgi:hypothetical protein